MSTTLKTCAISIAAMFFFPIVTYAQNIISQKKTTDRSLNRYVKNATVFSLNKNLTRQLHRDRSAETALSFEFENRIWVLELQENELFSAGFAVRDARGLPVAYDRNQVRHFKGKVKGEANSTVAVNLYDDVINAVIADSKGNINIGPLLNNSGDMIIFREADQLQKPSFDCAAIPVAGSSNPLSGFNIPESLDAVVNAEALDIYFEADYSCYTGKNSNLAATVNWVTDLANNVSVLYGNDSINVKLSGIKVWTVNDPYSPFTNTSTALSAFSTAMSGGFPGDLAHLLSRRDLGGGRAYLDVLCSSAQVRSGVSGNLASGITPLPAYSWNSMVITHELGHNIGSNHTQWCGWAGGAIDNCYGTEGGCQAGPAPVNGGTIMSYCHLNAGINLSNGFGPQPGALIRNKLRGNNCIFPVINFSRVAETVSEESADQGNGCSKFKSIMVNMKPSYAASMNTEIQLLPTAVSAGLQIGPGKDVEVLSPLNFVLSDTFSHTVLLKVNEDAIIEGNEIFRLDYNILPNGSNAKKGNLYTLTVSNSDHRPDSTVNQFIFLENFNSPGGWSENIIYGNAAPNRWRMGSSGDAEFPNPSLYISSNNSTAVYAGSSSSDSSVIRMISPTISCSGFTNIKLSYLYKCAGEGGAGTSQGGGSPADYGTLYFSPNNGVTWSPIREGIFGRAGKTVEILNLPVIANNNASLRFAFEWRNNSSIVNNPSIIIDSFMLSGTGAGAIQSDTHPANSDTANLGPNETVHFYNRVTGKVMATIKNLSGFDFGCTQVELVRTGEGATSSWGVSNAEKLMQKAFKISTSNCSATAFFELSLYCTANELAGWTTASGNNTSDLKIISSSTNITEFSPATAPVYGSSNSNTGFGQNGDRILKANFSGFGWFGMGRNGITNVCAGTTKQFASDINGNVYQWQLDSGAGYTNLVDGPVYNGCTGPILTVTNAPTHWYGFKYRCLVSTPGGPVFSSVNELKFSAVWKGVTSDAWELASNWECGAVPDANTDVYIPANVQQYPVINNNCSVRTLTILTGAVVTTQPGVKLSIER